MSKRGRDALEAKAKQYEQIRADRMREIELKQNALGIETKKKALNIEHILENCGLRKAKPNLKPRNKVPKVC